MRFPIQPLYDDDGVIRFTPNTIVKFLLDNSKVNLNDLACMGFSDMEWEQFSQLIGYSASGFCGLSYTSNETAEIVDYMCEHGMNAIESENYMLRKTLRELKVDLCETMGKLYGIHPDNLMEEPIPYVPPIYTNDPSWSTNSGTDQYGKWAEFEIAGVVQRMRWIETGTFLMGSPDTDVDRYNDETQHSVTLTIGYWLADTTCTQELWQSVMGTNPSKFNTSKQNPVERISWNDCEEFFTTVNQLQPNLNLRFPTEAEWENACRAGTTTPFSFGDNITTDLVNYDGNYPYNGAKKGIYRKSTIGVTDLPCNQWGLYQMHGNVWEWCSDWYDGCNINTLIDPTGPATGSYRVLRGGSWYGFGRVVRSALRYDLEPSFANDLIGFRLARGQ